MVYPDIHEVINYLYIPLCNIGLGQFVRIVRIKYIYKAVPYKPYKAYRGKVCDNTLVIL